MRPLAMCPITVQVARVLRDLPGDMFNYDGQARRMVCVFDYQLAAVLNLDVKRVREGLLKLERLGAVSAEDLLPGRSAEPKGRAVMLHEGHAAWRWLSAYDVLEGVYGEMQAVV